MYFLIYLYVITFKSCNKFSILKKWFKISCHLVVIRFAINKHMIICFEYCDVSTLRWNKIESDEVRLSWF